MEEKKEGSGKFLGVIFFLVGLVASLLVGWLAFPEVLFSKEKQPLNFSHAAHQDSSCEDCHFFREDGTYSGTPGISNCRECHEEMMTENENERILVEQYIQQEKEIPWKVYTWQPDNVYFTHVPHKGQAMECTRCHRPVEEEIQLPEYRANRITGYSKSTMKMVECEQCHAERGASNACHVCHK